MSDCNCSIFNQKLIRTIIDWIKEKEECDKNCKCLLCNIEKCKCGQLEVFNNVCEICSNILCYHCSYFNKNKCLECKPYK